MAEVQSIFNRVLLMLQLSLAFWQIVKFTPGGALVQGVMGWLLQPLRRSSDYALLRRYPGRLFKSVHSMIMTEHPPDFIRNADVNAITEMTEEVRLSYLGVDYILKLEGGRLLVNGQMSYYITPRIWLSIHCVAGALSDTEVNAVFIKSYKVFWEGVGTGAVMTFSGVLDSLILDSIYFIASNSSLLLPVNLSVSEEKVLKFLNLVGLFLQKKKLHWFIPLSFSFTSAVLEFCTPLRVWLYAKINTLFCSAMQLIWDKLPYSTRWEVYSLGEWVDNLKPSNDIQLKVVRGNIRAPIAGGAKVNREGATFVHPIVLREEDRGQVQSFNCRSFDIRCSYFTRESPRLGILGRGTGIVDDSRKRRSSRVEVDCYWDEYMRLCTLLSCIAKNRSGSLKWVEPNNKVHVYGLRQSVIHYAKSGFPNIYEMELENVIVT